MAIWCRKELLYVLVVCLGSMGIGEVGTYNSPAGQPLAADLGLSETQLSIFNAIAHLCAALGGFTVDFVMKRIGRKNSAIIGITGTLIGWIVLANVRKNFFWLAYLIRVIQGILMGASTAVCSMYIVELSPIENRGAFGSFHQLFSAIGISYLNLLNIFCGWRLLTYLAGLIQVLFLCFIWFIPESPAVERKEQKEDESIFQKKYMKGLVHTFTLALLQQLAGMDAILTNLNQIFDLTKSVLRPDVCAFIVSLATILAGCIAAPIINKIGRKKAWILSASGQTTGLILAWINEQFGIGSVLPLVALFIDVLCYDLGIGPIPWILTPELFPDTVRSTACSLTTGTNWLLSSVIMFVWPQMKDGLGMGWSFFFFAICCIISIIYGIFWMPETMSIDMAHDESELEDVVKKNMEGNLIEEPEEPDPEVLEEPEQVQL